MAMVRLGPGNGYGRVRARAMAMVRLGPGNGYGRVRA